jgi:NusA-like KH domain protein
MKGTINMQDMRYLNLFRNITRINTQSCFKYNQALIFCVPRALVPRAIGESGKNSRQLSKILDKKIKIIPAPQSLEDVKEFVKAVVSPNEFKDLEVKGDEVVIDAGSMNKASLIGREKRRLLEMKKIIGDFFGKEVRIV